MVKSYILPVEASIHVNDVRLHTQASALLAHSVELVLRTKILPGIAPNGFAGMLTLRRPDDTFVRIEPGSNGGIEAQVAII